VLIEELSTILPPFAFWHLARHGDPGALRNNLLALAAISLTATLLTLGVGDPEQWIALGIGIYASVSWVQSLAHRDRPAFGMIFRTRSLQYLSLAFGLLAFTGFGFGFWGAPFFLRNHGVSEEQLGPIVGGTAMFGGLSGVVLGGVISDRLRRRTPNGRIWVTFAAALLPIPFGLWLLNTSSTTLAYALNAVVILVGSMYIAPGISTVQDLLLPRMRATGSAAYLLAVTFIGLGLGPYAIGRLSQALGDLALAMQLALVVNLLAALLFLMAMRWLPRDEETRLERARALGETVTRIEE
jgi:MFS family permease